MNDAPALPAAEEAGASFPQRKIPPAGEMPAQQAKGGRTENARNSVSPQRFPGTARCFDPESPADPPVGAAVSRPYPPADPVILSGAEGEVEGSSPAAEEDPSTAAAGRPPLRMTETPGLAAEPGVSGSDATKEEGRSGWGVFPALYANRGSGPERVSSDVALRAHFDSLRTQAEALRRDYPDFDLDAALRDPAFVRLTAPALGVGVREAYCALHRAELDERARQRAAEASRTLLSRAVAAGTLRPREGGGLESAALTRSDYRSLPRREQLALKQRILDAAARGEKIYP